MTVTEIYRKESKLPQESTVCIVFPKAGRINDWFQLGHVNWKKAYTFKVNCFTD